MSSMFGMDIQAIHRLSGDFTQSASKVDALIKRLSSEVAQVPWQGRDADSFREAWANTMSPRLAQVAADLRSGAGDLRRHGDEQERISR